MARTVLITGGTGFLGSLLTLRLLEQGHEPILLKRSSSDLSRLGTAAKRCIFYNLDALGLSGLEEVFVRHKIDLVLHCATHYGRSEPSPARLEEVNVDLPRALLQQAITHGVRGFVNTDTVLDSRVSPYAASKKEFLRSFKTYSTKLACINVALEHFYGPGDDAGKFVTRVIQDLLRNEKTIALTPGAQRRDFIFIDDAAEAFAKVIDWAFEQGAGFHSYEIGSGKTISIREFVQLIQKLTGNSGTELAFGALPYRPSEVMESRVVLEAILRLGFQARVPLEEGLRRTIEFERVKLGVSA